MFGSKPRVGLDLKSLGCTEAVAAEIQDEEQLGAVLEELGIAQNLIALQMKVNLKSFKMTMYQAS